MAQYSEHPTGLPGTKPQDTDVHQARKDYYREKQIREERRRKKGDTLGLESGVGAAASKMNAEPSIAPFARKSGGKSVAIKRLLRGRSSPWTTHLFGQK